MSEEDSFNRDLSSTAPKHQTLPAFRPAGVDAPAQKKPMKRRKLPRGIFWRDGALHIRYKAHGTIERESTKQTSIEFAKQLLAKRKTERAEGKAFPTRRFERLKFGELLDAWWMTVPGTPHPRLGKKTASGFEYLLPAALVPRADSHQPTRTRSREPLELSSIQQSRRAPTLHSRWVGDWTP